MPGRRQGYSSLGLLLRPPACRQPGASRLPRRILRRLLARGLQARQEAPQAKDHRHCDYILLPVLRQETVLQYVPFVVIAIYLYVASKSYDIPVTIIFVVTESRMLIGNYPT